MAGGQEVRPGDILLGDDDGVLLLAEAEIEAWADELRQSEVAETALLEEFYRGRRISEMSGAQRFFPN